MRSLLSMLAFCGLIAAQFLAVAAVRRARLGERARDADAMRSARAAAEGEASAGGQADPLGGRLAPRRRAGVRGESAAVRTPG